VWADAFSGGSRSECLLKKLCFFHLDAGKLATFLERGVALAEGRDLLAIVSGADSTSSGEIAFALQIENWSPLRARSVFAIAVVFSSVLIDRRLMDRVGRIWSDQLIADLWVRFRLPRDRAMRS